MAIVDRWLLPDGVEDVLPPQARELEEVRRRFLDLFESWGYDYVIPPMIEYLESLEETTDLPLEIQTALETYSKALKRVPYDEFAITVALRRAPRNRLPDRRTQGRPPRRSPRRPRARHRPRSISPSPPTAPTW